MLIFAAMNADVYLLVEIELQRLFQSYTHGMLFSPGQVLKLTPVELITKDTGKFS